MMSQQPTPPPAPPPMATGSKPGHGPFTEGDIQQICADTGYDYDKVCHDIDATGAQTKEELYPNTYSGEGIEPQGQTLGGAGQVQGEAPPVNDRRAQAQAAMQGAPMQQAPPEEGEPAQSPQAESTEGESIPPEVAQAMHTAMAPPPSRPGRKRPGGNPAPKGAAWQQRMRR